MTTLMVLEEGQGHADGDDDDDDDDDLRPIMWVMKMMTMVVAMSCARVLLAVDSVAVDEYL